MSRGSADRVRGPRSERQTDAGRTARRGARASAARTCSSCRSPTTRRAIGGEIGRALHGERDYEPTACSCSTSPTATSIGRASNRDACRGRRSSSAIATSRRASPTAKRRASTRAWLADVQRYLPQPSLTLLLDIPPDASLQRKQLARDRYERIWRCSGACAPATCGRRRSRVGSHRRAADARTR